MAITDFLSQNAVMVDVRARDKRSLLTELCGKAAAALGLAADRVTADILKREELGSTGVGGGVAIPHARIQGLENPFGVLARLRTGIDFAAIDGEPVDIVFLLLLPGAPNGENLNVLASVSRKLRNAGITAGLRSAGDSGQAYRAIAAG
jgi:PTS system nitrogen regulatory IIA component